VIRAEVLSAWHRGAALSGLDLVSDARLDSWVVSAGVGYRFNLGDIFARSEPPQ
jgi:outer membrane protein W